MAESVSCAICRDCRYEAASVLGPICKDCAPDPTHFNFKPKFYKTEAVVIPQSQGDCNSCKHNGTWDCLKCHGFDKYERAT